jgi:hypothetical protein
MFTRPQFLFFQHNQQCDTLLPIVPCTHKLKAGISYYSYIAIRQIIRLGIYSKIVCLRACGAPLLRMQNVWLITVCNFSLHHCYFLSVSNVYIYLKDFATSVERIVPVAAKNFVIL